MTDYQPVLFDLWRDCDKFLLGAILPNVFRLESISFQESHETSYNGCR